LLERAAQLFIAGAGGNACTDRAAKTFTIRPFLKGRENRMNRRYYRASSESVNSFPVMARSYKMRARVGGKSGGFYDDGRQSVAPPLAYYGMLRDSAVCSLHIRKAVFGIPHRSVALRDTPRMAKACQIGYHLSWRDRNQRTKK
jgi:hypothetical protein